MDVIFLPLYAKEQRSKRSTVTYWMYLIFSSPHNEIAMRNSARLGRLWNVNLTLPTVTVDLWRSIVDYNHFNGLTHAEVWCLYDIRYERFDLKWLYDYFRYDVTPCKKKKFLFCPGIYSWKNRNQKKKQISPVFCWRKGNKRNQWMQRITTIIIVLFGRKYWSNILPKNNSVVKWTLSDEDFSC